MSLPWCDYCQQYFSLDAWLEHCEVVDNKFICVVEEENNADEVRREKIG